MLNYILQKDIIDYVYSDRDTIFKWKLSIALVSKQWFSIAKSLFHNQNIEYKFQIDDDIYQLNHLNDPNCLYYYSTHLILDLQQKPKEVMLEKLIKLVSRAKSLLIIRAHDYSAYEMLHKLVDTINNNNTNNNNNNNNNNYDNIDINNNGSISNNNNLPVIKIQSNFHLTRSIYQYEQMLEFVKRLKCPIVEWSVSGLHTVNSVIDINTYLTNQPIETYTIIKHDLIDRHRFFYFESLSTQLTTFIYKCSNLLPNENLLDFLQVCTNIETLELEFSEPEIQSSYSVMEPLFEYLDLNTRIKRLSFHSLIPHSYINRLLPKSNLKYLQIQMVNPVITTSNSNKKLFKHPQQQNQQQQQQQQIQPLLNHNINNSINNLVIESYYKPQFVNYPVLIDPTSCFCNLTSLSVRFSRSTIQHYQKCLSFLSKESTIVSFEISSSLFIDLVYLFKMMATNHSVTSLNITCMLQLEEDHLGKWRIISEYLSLSKCLQILKLQTYSDTPPVYIDFSEYISKHTQFKRYDIIPNNLQTVLYY